jgi:hypothetical protein
MDLSSVYFIPLSPASQQDQRLAKLLFLDRKPAGNFAFLALIFPRNVNTGPGVLTEVL